MTIESLIPTFEVSEQVLVHWRDVEWQCPGCGINICTDKERLGTTSIVTILSEASGVTYCRECGVEEVVDGWWEIGFDKGDSGCVPYTVLERVPVTVFAVPLLLREMGMGLINPGG